MRKVLLALAVAATLLGGLGSAAFAAEIVFTPGTDRSPAFTDGASLTMQAG